MLSVQIPSSFQLCRAIKFEPHKMLLINKNQSYLFHYCTHWFLLQKQLMLSNRIYVRSSNMNDVYCSVIMSISSSFRKATTNIACCSVVSRPFSNAARNYNACFIRLMMYSRLSVLVTTIS